MPEQRGEKNKTAMVAPSALKTSPVQGARQEHPIPSNFTAKLHRSLLEHKKKLKSDQSQDQLSVRQNTMITDSLEGTERHAPSDRPQFEHHPQTRHVP